LIVRYSYDKNIIFDFGNVLVECIYTHCSKELGLNEKDFNILNNIVGESEEWAKLDLGEISLSDAKKIWRKKMPKFLISYYEKYVSQICFNLPIIQDTLNLIKKLKQKGYNLFYLSNTSNAFFESEKMREVSKLFDGGVLSYKEHIVKPDEKIYKILLTRYNLIPNECAFIDDKENNVIAAKNVGINGIKFDYKKFNDLIINLKNIGVNY
jgi:putative hydrolase of the HAD superfamily